MPYLILGLIVLFFFLLQVLVCYKANKRIVKLLPFFLILPGAVYGFAVMLGAFGNTGWNDLVAMVIFLYVGAAFCAILAATLFCWSMRRSQKTDI